LIYGCSDRIDIFDIDIFDIDIDIDILRSFNLWSHRSDRKNGLSIQTGSSAPGLPDFSR
jgi:hypothetical protein